MALANNYVTDDKRKREIALELFEAYSSMSCCGILSFISITQCWVGWVISALTSEHKPITTILGSHLYTHIKN